MFASGTAVSQQAEYGDTTFPTSGSAEAQAPFMEGLLMLHSFEYEDAAEAFQRAQEIDPDFSMAYWGESLTHYRRLWYSIDLEKARAIMNKAGTMADVTPREKAYLASVAILYGEEHQKEREKKYAAALGHLASDFPDDENAKAFYSLALMWTETGDYRGLMKSAAVAEEVAASNPSHPGALHYLIHAYDTPVHAPLGLRAALLYDSVAPSAAHALHMPSHIYVALGMWDKASDINVRSYAAARDWAEKRGSGLNGNGAHAIQWLQYSRLQQGRFAEAKELFAEMQAETRKNPARLGQLIQAWSTYMAETNYEDPDFSDIEFDLSSTQGNSLVAYHFTRGAVAARNGDLQGAEEALEKISAVAPPPSFMRWSEEKREIAKLQIGAFMAEATHNEAKALDLLEQAVAIESSLVAESGLPSPVNPSPELYGKLLARLGRHDEAIGQFDASLKHYQGRSSALLGLAQAASAAGQISKSEQAYKLLKANLQDADSNFSPDAIETIKKGIEDRRSRDSSRLITMRIDIDAGTALAYRARKLGPEEHHLMLTDEPESRGGKDTAPSPLGLFMTGLGTCLMNQFNRLAISADLDLIFTGSQLQAPFSGEPGGDFKHFTQDVYAEGNVSEAQIEELMNEVDDFCRISVTLRRVVPMTTILHVNGAEVSRREYMPENFQ
jgi:tetratricopeptide (TPR) repeat protein